MMQCLYFISYAGCAIMPVCRDNWSKSQSAAVDLPLLQLNLSPINYGVCVPLVCDQQTNQSVLLDIDIDRDEVVPQSSTLSKAEGEERIILVT